MRMMALAAEVGVPGNPKAVTLYLNPARIASVVPWEEDGREIGSYVFLEDTDDERYRVHESPDQVAELFERAMQ